MLEEPDLQSFEAAPRCAHLRILPLKPARSGRRLSPTVLGLLPPLIPVRRHSLQVPMQHLLSIADKRQAFDAAAQQPRAAVRSAQDAC